MISIKREISLLLCAAFVFCSCMGIATVTAAEETTVISDAELQAIDMLNAIGAADIDVTLYNPNELITRGEFACYVAKLIKADGKGNGIYYYDVPEYHYAYDAVSALTELGYVSGTEEKMFSPDENMNIYDAYSVIIKILGYNMYLKVGDDYRTACYQTASRIELSKNCSGAEDVTMKDMLFLLKNSLMINLLDVSGMSGKGDIDYAINKNETLLSRYYDAYYNKGVVTAVNNMGVNGSKNLQKDEIEIDDLKYNTELVNREEFFGCEVLYIYKEENYSDREVIWLYRNKNGSVLEFDVDDGDCEFSPAEMKITINKESKKLSQGVTIIYNGENYLGGQLGELLSGERMKIKLISAKSSSVYDVIVIEAYELFSVESIDTNNMTVYGDNQKRYSLDDAEYDFLEIKNESNTEIAFSDIKIDNVVAYSKSISGRTAIITVTGKTVEGKLERITVRDKYTEAVIDGVTYKCYKNSLLSDKIGNNVKVYLDPYSCIYDIEQIKSESGAFFAYVLAADRLGLDQKVMLQLLDESGEIKVHAVSKNAAVNGVKSKNYDEIYKILCPSGSAKKQLIYCRLNSSGELSEINVAGSTDKFKVSEPEARVLYKSNFGKFGTKIIIDGNTKIFAVPDTFSMDEADVDKDFMVKKKSDVLNDTQYTVESYVVDKENAYADAVVIYGHDWNVQSVSASCVLIEEIITSVNEDGEIVEGIEGYNGSGAVRFYASSDFSLSGYKSGDIVKIFKNGKNEITGLEKVYSMGETYDTSGYAGTLNSAARYIVVHAHDRIGPVVKVGYENGASYDELFDLSKAKVLVYDKNARNEKIKIGSYSDILTYKSAGDNCSDMVIQANYGSIIFVAIFND